MSAFTPLLAVHALAALCVLLLGPVQILRPRRDAAHRLLGRAWGVAMLVTCTTSFGIHPHGFGWLHALSVWTLFCLVTGVVAIRRGDVRTHRGMLVGSWLGTVGAFVFAVAVPQRAIPQLLRSEPLVALATFAGVALIVVAGSGLVIGRTQRAAVRSPRRRAA